MSIQEANIKRQAQDLERSLKGVMHLLEDAYADFQQMCRVFNPKRGYSPTAIRDIKEIYKTASAKFAEAKALQQLLRGKYRGYVQVNPQIQRQVDELSLMYRKDYRFFELNQSTWEREQRIKKEKALPLHILSHLYHLYQESPSLFSLVLCFQANFSALKEIQQRVSLGERDTYDITDNEIWFCLAGVTPSEDAILRSTLIETLLKGLTGNVKGLALKVTKEEEISEDVLRTMRQGLAGLKDGEIKIL
jgi:hypothetical protein